MNSPDKQALDDTRHPVEQDEAGGTSDTDGDEQTLVIRVQERQLVWIAIGILALFVVIEGIAILSLRSNPASFGPQPYGGDQAAPSGWGQGQDPTGAFPGSDWTQGRDAPGPHTGNSRSGRPNSSERAPTSEGGQPNNSAMPLVTGEEALSRVKVFISDFDLEEEDSEAVLAAVTANNAAIGALDARRANGELEGSAYSVELQRCQEDMRLEILKVIGWQRTANLYERLRASSTGEPGTPPAR